MNTIEVEHFAKGHRKISKYFIGVHPSNYLPDKKITSYPAYLIINSCSTFDSMLLESISDFGLSELGCHWVAVVVDRHKTIFFDSSAQNLHNSHKQISIF